jgi:hypothetical protein
MGEAMANSLEIPQPSAAAIRLFACITRFEFALKESGYVAGEEGKRVTPDWDRFEADAMKTNVLELLRASGAAAVLLDTPPRRQIRSGNGFEWGDRLQIRNARQLCVAVRQVRNNLFHGGKSGADPRDNELCEGAAEALLVLLEVEPKVRHAFLGEY